MGSRPTVKVYGERNSGTNYLRQLIGLNFGVQLLTGEVPPLIPRIFRSAEFPRDLYFRLTYRRNLGWKHATAPDAARLRRLAIAREVIFVTITKNPYAWLLSMYRRPYHQQKPARTFADFLCQPWNPLGRENRDLPYQNPITLWNAKNLSYLELAEHARCANLRYEDVLADPAGTLDAVASRFELGFDVQQFRNVDHSTKRDDRTFAGYRDYYLNSRWKSKLDRSAVAIINDHLDRAVTDRLGYSIVGGI